MVRITSLVLAVTVGAPVLHAQLPGTLIDVSDPASAAYCGIDHTYSQAGFVDPAQMCGVACADFDGDGWVDVFLPGNAGQANSLYRNQGDGTFADVAALHGLDDPATASASGIFLDYDKDGDLDLVVAAHAGHTGTPGDLFRLFRNGGAALAHVFEDVSAAAGFALAPTIWPTDRGWQGGLAVSDYDRDGHLDLFAPFWSELQVDHDTMWRLFRSAPNPEPGDPADPAYTPRVFVDATTEAGLDFAFLGEPWQAMFTDIDRDGFYDLHVCVDFDLDYMFMNNGDGTFTNQATDLGLNGFPPEKRNEMGSALGDVDNDGDLDLHVTNLFELDRFYRADTSPFGQSYVDVAFATGLNDSAWGWGDVFFDFDNDGDLDHSTVTGYESATFGLGMYNTLHLNLFPQRLDDGVTVAWQNVMVQVPEYSKVFTHQGDSSRGLSWLDYDNDGDIDLVVTRYLQRTAVYRNTLSSPDRWLQVDLVEADGSLDTVGARVWVKTSDRVQLREVIAGSSFMSQEPPRLHFGLGPPNEAFERPAIGTTGSLGGVGGRLASSGPAPAGSPLAGPVTPGGGTNGGATLPVPDPAWLVVRWFDGSYQVVKAPPTDTILQVVRAEPNDAGDMDADGHLTPTDRALLLLAVEDPATFQAAWPASPGMIVGDIDGNGFVEPTDYDLWLSLPPH